MLGLIGGLSWPSTIDYYRVINTEYNQRKGHNSSCPILLYSFDFEKIEALQKMGDWETLCRKITGAGLALKNGGATLLMICSNTMNVCAGELEIQCQLPVIHIAREIGNYVQQYRMKRVGLIGTRYLMNMDFYPKVFEQDFSIEILLPGLHAQEQINHIIYEELVKGIVREDSRKQLTRIIQDLIQKGAEGVILGCTELPIILRKEYIDIPVFDTTYIHALAGVNYYLGNHL